MPYRPPTPQDKARYVRGKFDEIARHYDLFNDLITQGQHRAWKRVLVRRLGIAPDARGLDLCCGTGDIAARCLPLLGPRGQLIAADFSRGMLSIARQRLELAQSRRTQGGSGDGAGAHVAALCGDAMRLPFAAQTFDFVTVGYGLRNVSDLGACLDELRRVLRPGGILASLDIGKVDNRLLRPLVEFYLYRIVPRIGGLLQRGQDMFEYLPHSTASFPHQEELARLLAGHGFERVEVLSFLFGASVIHLAHRPV